MDLAADPDRYRLAVRIQQVNLCIRYRTADRNDTDILLCHVMPCSDVDGCFGGSVQIVQLAFREMCLALQ